MLPRGSRLLIAGVLLAVLVPAGIDLGGAMNGSDSTPAPAAAAWDTGDAAVPPASESTGATPTPTAAPQSRATNDARLEPVALFQITLSRSLRSP